MSGHAALLASCVAGLYVAVFYTVNNWTMLRGGGILVLFSLLILPLAVSTALVYFALDRAGKGGWARAAVAFIISAFLLFMLRPSLLDFEIVDSYFRAFPAGRSGLATTLFIVVPATLLTLIFHRKLKEYAAILGVMTLAAALMGAGKMTGGSGAADTGKRLAPNLQQVLLAERPNIYFILADAYGSLAYMEEHEIDVAPLTGFLSANDFRLYEDTYSNYQPTTSALPAILNMEHHYYRLTGHRVEFSEVDRASRRIIGGENNVSHILKRNGYSIQYIHNGTYLLLQGCSADVCFPEIDGLAGARIILSHMLKTDLLSDEDKAWETTTLAQMGAQVSALLDDEGNVPRFQYIHAFTPGHPSHGAGKCDEGQELKKYATRVEAAGRFLRKQIRTIVDRDPDAVIVLAGDHGPLLSKGCKSNAYIDNASDYRDRAGAIIAIRWPKSYGGQYDDRISSGVNLFRFVLASLAEDDEPLIQTTAPDDVFVRAGNKIFKIVENGLPLDQPKLAVER